MLLPCGMKKTIHSAFQQQYITDFRSFLLMRNYAATTIKSYIDVLCQFWAFCREQQRANPAFDKEKVLAAWFLRITENFGAGTVYNQNYSSLKLFYTYQLKREWQVYGILRPRKTYSLPEIMSKLDVDKLLCACTCLKHRTIFLTMYATGLRVSELVQLKIEDIDSQSMTIRVRKGKGGKDRLLPLTEPLLLLLRDYVKLYRPVDYLFNGLLNGKSLSTRAVQNAFQLAKQKARLNPKISAHTLRHAFATHHLDDGTHLPAIKTMLGHTNIKTTERYLHLSIQSLHQFNNPADELCKKFIK
jgi:integrase/recombinase XerD